MKYWDKNNFIHIYLEDRFWNRKKLYRSKLFRKNRSFSWRKCELNRLLQVSKCVFWYPRTIIKNPHFHFNPTAWNISFYRLSETHCIYRRYPRRIIILLLSNNNTGTHRIIIIYKPVTGICASVGVVNQRLQCERTQFTETISII